MPSVKTPQFRKVVDDRRASWKHWKSVHSWTYVLVGSTSSAVAIVVACNAKGQAQSWKLAAFAAVLTFVISALGSQSEAKAFETGARLLEGALAKYDSNPDYGDIQLGEALANAVDALNRKS